MSRNEQELHGKSYNKPNILQGVRAKTSPEPKPPPLIAEARASAALPRESLF